MANKCQKVRGGQVYNETPSGRNEDPPWSTILQDTHTHTHHHHLKSSVTIYVYIYIYTYWYITMYTYTHTHIYIYPHIIHHIWCSIMFKHVKGIVSALWNLTGSRLSWDSIILIIAIYRDTPPQTTCFAPVAFGSWLAPAHVKQQCSL